MDALNFDFTKLNVNKVVDKFKERRELIGIGAMFIIIAVFIMRKFFTPKNFIPNDEFWEYKDKTGGPTKHLYLFHAEDWCRYSKEAKEGWLDISGGYAKFTKNRDRVRDQQEEIKEKHEKATNLERKWKLHEELGEDQGRKELRKDYKYTKLYELMRDKNVVLEKPILVSKFNSPVKFSTLVHIEQSLIDKKDEDFLAVKEFIHNHPKVVLDAYPMIFLETVKTNGVRDLIEFDADFTYDNLYEFLRFL